MFYAAAAAGIVHRPSAVRHATVVEQTRSLGIATILSIRLRLHEHWGAKVSKNEYPPFLCSLSLLEDDNARMLRRTVGKTNTHVKN